MDDKKVGPGAGANVLSYWLGSDGSGGSWAAAPAAISAIIMAVVIQHVIVGLLSREGGT